MRRIHELKSAYKKVFELGLIFILSAHIVVFLVFGRSKISFERPQADPFEDIRIKNIIAIEKPRVAPPPPMPQVPIPAEREELPQDATIDPVKLELAKIPELPPPPVDTSSSASPEVFIPYEEPPAPVGGMVAIQKKLRYPISAINARIGGTVLLKARIRADGEITDIEVSRSFGYKPCERAAIKAVQSVRWKPARLRHQAVSVWVSIPVTFASR